MYKAINIEFIIILITVQCVNLNSFSDNKEKKVLINAYSDNSSSAMKESEKFKQCKYLGEFLLCSLDHLKQWKWRRRFYFLLKQEVLKTTELYWRGKRSSWERTMQRWRLTAPLEPDAGLIAKFKARWPVELWRSFLFTDDYLLLINEHWLHFTPPAPAANYTLGSLYVLMMLVGCSGNALVLLMYFRCRTLRTPGNILVANLALSDFFMLAKTPVFIFNSFNLGPALGKTGAVRQNFPNSTDESFERCVMNWFQHASTMLKRRNCCVIYGFVGGLTGTTSIATLAAIALDRYWAVVRPLEPLRALTAVRARLLAAGAWLYAAAFASIPALDIGYGRYVPEGYLTSCSFDYLTEELPPRYFIFTFFCAAWVAPFFTITFCYLNILRVVVCSRNVNTANQEQRLSSRHVKQQVKRKAEIKLAALVIVVIALFFVSWTPYAVVALMGIFGKKDLITPIVSMIPALFCKTAACINPFIYIITHPKFRSEFRKLVFRDKSRRMSAYNKTIGYTEADTTRVRRVSKDSDTEVEIIQMKDILPYDTEENVKSHNNVKTISSRVSEREGSQKSQRSVSMKSFKESVVSPPSWYAKPQFSKKKSFHRRSSRSVVSMNPDPIILCRTLRTPGNILVANLALSDFFMLAKTPVFIFNSFNLGPALGKTGCVIYGFVGGLTGTTSIATLAAIALDRYWAVVRPLEPLRALTAVRARLLAAGAWLYAAAFASVPALDIGYGRYVPEGYLTSCSFDYLTEELPPRYFIFTFFCAAWVAPFFTITFCYLNILRVVVCSRNVKTANQEQRLSSRHVKQQVKRKAEIKLAALVIVVIALFFVSWTPYAVVALMGIFGKKDLITPIVSMIPALFCKTAACINPFIYIITHPKFRSEFRKLVFRDKSRRMSAYNKTIGYTEADTTRVRRVSKDSDTEVEIIQMKDILPYDTEENVKSHSNVKTISSRVSEREGSQKSQRSVSMKSFKESVVSPPSWYAKPQFSKKKSFHRRSSRSVVSMNPDPIIL